MTARGRIKETAVAMAAVPTKALREISLPVPRPVVPVQEWGLLAWAEGFMEKMMYLKTGAEAPWARD
jgi:hypothetical protein